ncbi:unnamed protein product [Aphanomyces euteiches]
MVYRIQAADTREEFASHLANLALNHANIANEIDQDVWMYGWRTTNFVESANGAAIPSRLKFPLQFFKDYMDKFMDQAFECQEQGEEWVRKGLIATPFAENAIKEQQKLAGTFTVHRKTSSVAFVRAPVVVQFSTVLT